MDLHQENRNHSAHPISEVHFSDTEAPFLAQKKCSCLFVGCMKQRSVFRVISGHLLDGNDTGHEIGMH